MSEHTTTQPTTIRPVAAAHVANLALRKHDLTTRTDGTERKVTSQAMFNRAKSGTVGSNYAAFKAGTAEHVELDLQDFGRWLAQYLEGIRTGNQIRTDAQATLEMLGI